MTVRILSERRARVVKREAASGGRSRQYEALLSGRTVHHDDNRNHYNSNRIRHENGLQLHSRSDGLGGRFWWTTPVVPR